MLEELQKRISKDVRAAEPMAKYTTLKVGGPAEYFFEAKNADDAAKAAKAAKDLGLPLFFFGGGSNLLVNDDGVKGLVLKMTLQKWTVEGDTVMAEAGVPSGLLSMKTTDAGLCGFEWAIGLPGTVGGAVRGNAGMFGGEMKGVTQSVRVIRDGEDVTLTGPQCEFDYRTSVFKKQPGMIVLSAVLNLKKADDPAATKALLQKYLVEKKDKQPIEYPCAGCIFMNWKPERPEELESLRKSLDLNKEEEIPIASNGTVPAGWIIDRAQLKGSKIGHVTVSDKHANFFVSDGKATADDFVQLIAFVKTKVRKMTGGFVSLMEEIEYVGF